MGRLVQVIPGFRLNRHRLQLCKFSNKHTRYQLDKVLEILGPKLLLVMGCVKLGEKTAFTCLLWVNKPQINYQISRNPWQVIILESVGSVSRSNNGKVSLHCLQISDFGCRR